MEYSISATNMGTGGCRTLTRGAGAMPAAEAASAASRILILAYGVACYAVFFATFLYSLGFIGGFGTPTTLDGPRSEPSSFLFALIADCGLLLVFAVQHSVMARPWFKACWTRIVPEPAERSTYVLFSSLAMIAMFAFWRPLGGTIWSIESHGARLVLYALCFAGFALVLYATFLINHFDLFGLRQVWLYFRKRHYTHVRFATPAAYRVIRHPLYAGWLIAFWATPTMSAAHLLFAVLTTVYIFMAIRWEERDLAEMHGSGYAEYRATTPMLVPSVASARRAVMSPATSRGEV